MYAQVSEGLDVLNTIGTAFIDARHRPLQTIRIKHTTALESRLRAYRCLKAWTC